MNLLSKLPGKLTRTLGKLWLKTKHISPEICTVTGIACGVGAIVLVGVKTWKNKQTMENDLDGIKVYTTKFEPAPETISEKDAKKLVKHPETGETLLPVHRVYKSLDEAEKKQLWARRIDFAKDICKIYWIPAVLGVSSIGLIWGGRTILRKELSAVTAAYATLLESYRQYREKVAKVIGSDKEQELANGYYIAKNFDAEEEEFKSKPVIDKEENLSQYGFWFDEGDFDKETQTWTWRNDVFNHGKPSSAKIANRLKVVELQDKYTFKLRTIGYAWLEDLALEFGIDPDEAKKFHDVGWVYKEGSENRVELGVLESVWQLNVNRGFCDDRCSQQVCFINPNVDGYIGYIRSDFKKYDKRYGSGKKKQESTKRRFAKILYDYREDQMENMIFNAMSENGKRRLLERSK